MTEKDLLGLLESWDNFEILLAELRSNPQHLPALMQIAIYSDHRNSWRAIYLADKLHENQAEIIEPYLEEILEQLKTEQHHGKKRHFLKLISLNSIPEQHFGFLMDYCLNTFTSAKEPIANRVHAMQILYNISETEPDLKPELIEIIQQEIEHHPTPGIRSRGNKLLQKLRKQTGIR
ncbi:hypothetical protein [Maribellus sediminis]|uniref:hypothetical protein n=1 Tax=Maribellus sediminis TaxID=2696285 RepID=UPI0014311B95|nr:hypothetical protein [Maribellus sediminis]